MVSARSVVRWGGVAVLLVGVAVAVTPLYYGYAPLAASTWWDFNFNMFWGGIAAIIVGVAAVLGAQYLMTAPMYEQRKELEIPA